MAEQFSYSKIDTYKTCPYKYKLKYIDRIKEKLDNNIAIQKGSLVHKLLERKVNNETNVDDPELVELLHKLVKEDITKILKTTKKFIETPFFKSLDFSNATTEEYFYLDTNLNPCLKPKAFMVGKIDYKEFKEDYILIIDWKTGKKTAKDIQLYKTDDLQLDLYALWALQKYPEYENINAMLYYVESEIFEEKLFCNNDIDKLKEKIHSRINEVRVADTFVRKLGTLCDYCYYFADYCNGK